MSALGDLLLDLLAIPSTTGDEAELAGWVADRAAGAGLPVRRIGNSVVAGALDPRRSTVLLVGHLDVVPPTSADREPRREGPRIVGRGASDMKGGLAVAMACVEDPALRAGPRNPVLVAYAGEEGPAEGNELQAVLDTVPELAGADLAVVLEPTDGQVQLGCMGGLHVEVTIAGRAAHSARPWHGENALSKAAGLLGDLHERPPRDVEVDDLVYREVIVPTQARTNNARNVVPDRFLVNLNYRFAPDKDPAEAAAVVDAVVAGRGETAVVDVAPPARPQRHAPAVAAFLQAAGVPVGPKQAWTDVARLAAVGVPALNFGPGLTAQAHQEGEYAVEADLEPAYTAVARFLAGDGSPDDGGPYNGQ